MARVGISYNDVKTAAYKLLTRGESPSVQKIRDLLGTGSNTTIAEHLRVWREEYAKKEVHHLPANMPQELVSAIEVLWQTAMEQAENQLTEVKKDLDLRKEQFTQEQAITQKSIDDLNSQKQSLSEKIDKLTIVNADLKTELTLSHERLTKSLDELANNKAQFESRLHRAYDEKTTLIEHSEKLEDEIKQLQKQLNEQSKSHQSHIANERTLQEESEKRWLNLIDQSRQETKTTSKKYEALKSEFDTKTKQYQESILTLKQTIQEGSGELKLVQAEKIRLASDNAEMKADIAKLRQQVNDLNLHVRQQSLEKKSSKETVESA